MRWLTWGAKKSTTNMMPGAAKQAAAPRRPLAYEAMIENAQAAKPLFLVLSGCQHKMIAGFLETLTLGKANHYFLSIEKVNAFDKGGWKAYQEELDKADYIYTQKKKVADFLLSQHRYKDKVYYFPVISCAYFHPDIAYIQHSGKKQVGPLGDYHSILVTAAYFAGLSQQQALMAFKPEIYNALGFEEKKQRERAAFINRFKKEGVDLSSCVARWDKDGQWMRTVNHPVRYVIYEIVYQVLQRDEVPIANHSPSVVDWVEDDLARSAEWPLYPLNGNNDFLIFKSPYSFLDKGIYFNLKKFVEYSFASLDGVDRENINVMGCDIEKAINVLYTLK
ncbi:WcbI family polysaccharide biosynthesis putative acetyltransferase [Halomonas citrativorans]|uniref:Polysaccharide biosynthesis enzyme WcbI domain-containing protein n=1 Tax=Halomonas citrativorans TaxID=2742612 RepID=A0ABR9FGI7_9GAMM|nr:WcbI family polysaccharide biosynthesis putative acetyltransferase [Halomonas citrativorans]MBE0405171.1 hypothetical protein [Halomonas citrativorans]